MYKTTELQRQRAKQWRKNNPNKVREMNWKKRGIIFTYEEYEKIIKKQKHKCAICGRSQKQFKIAFNLDHCHKTNKVRGLLCTSCNFAIGHIDNKKWYKKAKKYLEQR